MSRKPKIIEDKKLRGEWAESVFMARAGEHGLAVSKPWGEMCSYDFVIGKTGRFVSVQVKSTLYKDKGGYVCTVRGGHKAYSAGSFDFLAAYTVIEDAWYIIPAELIRGKECITLYPNSRTAKYEKYREAWHLLREASGSGEKKDETREENSAGDVARERGSENKDAAEQNAAPQNSRTRRLSRRLPENFLGTTRSKGIWSQRIFGSGGWELIRGRVTTRFNWSYFAGNLALLGIWVLIQNKSERRERRLRTCLPGMGEELFA